MPIRLLHFDELDIAGLVTQLVENGKGPGSFSNGTCWTLRKAGKASNLAEDYLTLPNRSTRLNIVRCMLSSGTLKKAILIAERHEHVVRFCQIE